MQSSYSWIHSYPDSGFKYKDNGVVKDLESAYCFYNLFYNNSCRHQFQQLILQLKSITQKEINSKQKTPAQKKTFSNFPLCVHVKKGWSKHTSDQKIHSEVCDKKKKNYRS